MRMRIRPWGAAAGAAVVIVSMAVFASPGAAITPATVPVVTVGRTDVPVGSAPLSVAFTKDGRQAYVANTTSNTVSVVDVASAMVTATVPVAPEPLQVLNSPDGKTMYVSSFGSTGTNGGVTAIDVATHTVSRWIPTGEESEGIAIRPGTSELWIGLNRGAIRVVDLASGAVQEIGVGSTSRKLTFSPDGTSLFLVTQTGLTFGFGQLDVATRHVIYWDAGNTAEQIAFSPDAMTRYEISGSSGVFDTVSRTWLTGNAAAVAFRPDSSQLFALSGTLPEVTVFDPLRREATGTFAVGNGQADIQVSPDGRTLITANSADNTVSIVSLPDEVPPAGLAVDRISGADRFQVSAAISQRGFPAGAPVAYVASGTGFPDALSAAPAAAAKGGPVLLTMPGALPDVIRAELVRLHPGKIVLVGGPAVISDDVLAQLSGIATTVRVWGADRYATSKAVVDDAFAHTPTLFVASGENFPDALSAGAAAAKSGAPVLLIPGHGAFPQWSADPPTADTLSRHGVTDVRFVGGPASITDSVFSSFTFAAYGKVRLFGGDRYSTSIAVNASEFDTATHVYVASGVGYPDALGGSALAGATSSPLYVVPPGCLPSRFIMELQHLGTTNLTLIGGPAALSPADEQLAVCG